MKKNKQKILALLFILPLVAIIASLILVQQTQEVRRSAAYGEINVQLLPDHQEAQLSDGSVSVQVQVLSGNYSVSGSHFKISYDPSILSFESSNFHTNFQGQSYAVQEGTVEIVAYLKSNNSSPSDVFNLVTLNFNLVGQGSCVLSSTGAPSFVGSISQEGWTDRVLDVNSFADARVEVSGEVQDLVAGMSLDPAEDDISSHQFTVKIRMDTNGEDISAADAVLDYDKQKLGVAEVRNGGLFEVVDQGSQEGNLVVIGYFNQPEETIRGSGVLAEIDFEVLETGTAIVDFACSEPYVAGNSGAWDLEANNLLDCDSVSGGVYHLSPVPTPTAPPGGWPELTFQVKFGGTEYRVNDQEKIVDDIGTRDVDVIVKGDGETKEYEDVEVVFNSQAVGVGSLDLVGLWPERNYVVSIKGPVHLARRFCKNEQTEHCWLGEGGINLASGNNSMDWTGLYLEPGDIDYNGVVNSADFSDLKQALMVEGDVQEDINFNGIVNGQDVTFFLQTLSTKYEDEI